MQDTVWRWCGGAWVCLYTRKVMSSISREPKPHFTTAVVYSDRGRERGGAERGEGRREGRGRGREGAERGEGPREGRGKGRGGVAIHLFCKT